MSVLPEYMSDVVKEMRRKSDAIRRDFATHRPSAGANREDLVKEFLDTHLPKRFGIDTGLIISYDGTFSTQADLLVVDEQNNAPLYPNSTNKLWPVESVYALIEVKTRLSPSELQDAIDKGRRFKRLRRQYCDAGPFQRINDSLFVIWAFESASPEKLKEHLVRAFFRIPNCEQPDLVVIPHNLVAKSGKYLELSRIGQPGSEHRKLLESAHGDALIAPDERVEVAALGDNALLAWYIWFDSWLRQAGPRFANPALYLDRQRVYGSIV